ncbi:TDP-N-acetylfucosamine:lipid II N-acetylfucosaminyltransferase [Thiopseudomonas acetoxidans]|uniref:TDP-N-acetylfucosamine:lipid II N-acetylfucosaminyltransferase n=1 Tax=Thiopseudomonas acetoxidans TaxID=3041622 RepID=A0ABT7SRM6_9GAMM|nr:TDP-N-acetylfucosamine:lipid II N-acetylfucosaminyltransferase [Thiopseudomonas sp. CY1220]MDM7858843.1 TDP-N-acetylfucosamine:lipid II N-acetylfucosaminyltransferase [Thiopseudomonas sp. CY1220]
MKILHVGIYDKLLPPFIELIKKSFDFNQHVFLLHLGMGNIPHDQNVKVYERKIIERLKFYFVALLKMHRSDKLILHGLFDIKLIFVLFFTPWLLRKCYWAIWGGDLYVYKSYEVPAKQGETKNILVGNSADPSNNHLKALEKLLPFKEQDIAIYCPLSYGNHEHAQKVIKQGKEWFGDKFKPLTKFMPFDEYLKLLGTIDIAIFNHKRQQAMGNTITLLGLGKTVYMRSDTTQWQFFQNKQITVGDAEEIKDLSVLDVSGNRDKIKQHFSKENFISQLESIFESGN